MKSPIPFLAALLILFPSSAARCDEFKRDLPVAEAVAMALRGNLDLRVEQLTSAMNEAELARVRAIYDPILTMAARSTGNRDFNGSRFRNEAVSAGISKIFPLGTTISFTGELGNTKGSTFGTIPQSNPPEFGFVTEKGTENSASVTVIQPLLKNAWDVTDFPIRIASQVLEDSLERFRFAAADTAMSVITAYNRLYALRQQRESARLSLDAARIVLDETKAQVAAGTLAPMEITSAEFGVVQRQKELIDTERAVSDQAGFLRVLTGAEDRRELIPVDPPQREEVELSERQALEKAFELRGDLRQLRNVLKISEMQEKFARNQTLPELDLHATGSILKSTFGRAQLVNNDILVTDGGRQWSADLTLTYPFGNNAAENEYRRARLRTEQVRQQIASLSRRIENEVQSDFRALISARLQIRAADKAREYAEQRLVDYREKKARGAATAKEVLDVESELALARSSQVEAAQAYADAATKLRRDTGLLLDHLGIRIDTSKPQNLMGG